LSKSRRFLRGQPRKRRDLTVAQAITQVLGAAKRPMTAKEICQDIQSQGLYDFRAADPVSIVRQQIRRRCMNLDLASSSAERAFKWSREKDMRS
jgi:restriction system protein